ncbi:metallophosphoesterase [bacterium]|nr:metallophosphoesterase [bacterium]
MRRRDFLKAAGGAVGLLALGSPGMLMAKPASALRLTLVHTNDVHSHLEPKSEGEYAGLGGAPARSAMIDRFRAENDHVLLLDAGDTIQGTPYFNLFQGEPEMRAMSAQGYVASTIGNHEFDPGMERLAEIIDKYADFPFLNANYDFTNTPMQGKTRESILLERDGLVIGLFGLGIKLEGLVSTNLYGETRYLDPIEEARRVARRLRLEEGADFVICLSHINIGRRKPHADEEPGDRQLIQAVPEIDVVLGGHNHVLLREPERYERASGPGFVNQVGWAGTHLGVLQFDIFDRQKIELASAGPAAV